MTRGPGSLQTTKTLATMLNTSYTWGTSPDNLTFVKQFDTQDKSAFAVSGVLPSAARTFTASHQTTKTGVRHLVDFSEVDAVAGSTSGATETTRMYVVIQRPPGKTEASIKSLRNRVVAALGSDAFLTAILNREV